MVFVAYFRCGHCKRLKPEFAKAAEELQLNDPPIKLVKVDCTEAGKDTCSKFSVSGYPTLRIFREGELSQEYNGPRDAAGIVKYMRAQVGPSSKDLDSQADFDKFLSNADVSVVGFFTKEDGLKETYLKLANKLREKVRFAHTTNKDLAKKYDATDAVILFRPKHLHNKFEEEHVKYDGKDDVDALQKFITDKYHGLVGHRRSDNYNEFNNPLVVAYYSVDYVKNVKGTNYWRNRILKVILCILLHRKDLEANLNIIVYKSLFFYRQVAKEFANTFNFAVSSKDDFQHELNEFGVDFVKGDKPVVFAKDEKSRKFVMKDEFS